MSAPQRVMIIGSGGAGKSTLARELGEALGLPVVHLDTEFWRPGWVASPEDEWAARVDELVARERWIMDGNYGGTMEARIEAADTVIFLDTSRWRCLWRVVRRRIAHRGVTRPDMAPGCPEKVDREFLRWIWNYPRDLRAPILGLLAAFAPGRRVIILSHPREVRRFLAGARAGRLPDPVPALQRIVVTGRAGAGKTTLVRRLARLLAVPAIELDQHLSKGEWGVAPASLHAELAAEATASQREWVMEGVYWRPLNAVLPSASSVVYLEFSSPAALRNFLRRGLPEGGALLRRVTEFARGLAWALVHPLSERRRIRNRVARVSPGKPVFRLRSNRDTRQFAEALARAVARRRPTPPAASEESPRT